MGVYIEPGACKNEIQTAKDAVKEMKKAYKDYLGAKANIEAGAWGAGGGVAGILLCGALSLTGAGALICLVGGGVSIISGSLWSASGIPGLEDAVDDLNDAIDKAETAVDALCECINSHAVSIPD